MGCQTQSKVGFQESKPDRSEDNAAAENNKKKKTQVLLLVVQDDNKDCHVSTDICVHDACCGSRSDAEQDDGVCVCVRVCCPIYFGSPSNPFVEADAPTGVSHTTGSNTKTGPFFVFGGVLYGEYGPVVSKKPKIGPRPSFLFCGPTRACVRACLLFLNSHVVGFILVRRRSCEPGQFLRFSKQN